jgi:hypothetical protein
MIHTSSVARMTVRPDDGRSGVTAATSGSRHLPMTARDGPMDPLGTLIVSLGALIVLDLAATQLGGSRRTRPRHRVIRSR